MANEDIQKELARRELAKRNFTYYVRYINPEYIWSKWNRVLCRILDRVERGEISFLLVEVSPRWGKTELIAKIFPSYVLGRNPKRKSLVTSYSDVLATESARHCLEYTQKQEYKNIFDLKLGTKKEGGNWETSKRGGYYSAGLLGSITGKGFDIGIIDDYVKNREEAESKTIRDKTYDNYSAAFVTRDEKSIQKKTSKIIFATRWNDDDLGGRILKKAEETGKTVIRLNIEDDEEELNKVVDSIKEEEILMMKVPATNLEETKSNYPERFSLKQLMNLKDHEVEPRDWEALYMQDPIKSSGNVFKKEEFNYFALSDIEWKDYTLAIHIDPAWSTRSESDDLAVAVTARHKITKEIYEMDIFGKTLLPSQAYSYIVSLAEKWKQFAPLEYISIEKVDLSKKQGEFIAGLEAYMRQQDKFYTVLYHEPRGLGKKEDRIKFTLEPMFNRGAIHFRCDDVGNRDYQKQETQLLKFPFGAHDDMADVLCQGVLMWEKRGGIQKQAVNEMLDDYYSS